MYNITLKNEIPWGEKERCKKPRLGCDVVHLHVSKFQMAPRDLAHTLYNILPSHCGQRSSPFPEGIKCAFTLLLWRKQDGENVCLGDSLAAG